MVSITIRNVPDAVRDELGARAALAGRSLQEYLASVLEDLAAKPSLDRHIHEIRTRAHSYPALDPDAVVDDLDRERR